MLVIYFSIVFLFSTSTISCDDTQTFIVGVQNELKPSIYPSVENWYISTLKTLNPNPLQPQNNPHILHLYKTVFQGFSARLTYQQAERLQNYPEILGLFPDHLYQIQTTRTPGFLGLDTSIAKVSNTLLDKSDFGSNVIIGMFDTGIYPLHPSFSDHGLDPIPSRWKGQCAGGHNFPKTLCNKKLIGVRYFNEGYRALNKSADSENQSAIDTEGHGTHTTSTAAGRRIQNASFLGYAEGDASGIAPKARIAVYKICWKLGCADSDILAAFDKAVDDGVDIISLSVGSMTAIPYTEDSIGIGAFGAMLKGVFISAAAGNSGSGNTTVTNVVPWITTVGASTIDRTFPADLVLDDGRVFTGSSLYSVKKLPANGYQPLILASLAGSNNSSKYCQFNSLDPTLVRGKIVVCESGQISSVDKSVAVKDAGGTGFVVTNSPSRGYSLIAQANLHPGLGISEADGHDLIEYIKSSTDPKATIVFRGTQLDVKPAPMIAAFSSRGPNRNSMYVLKPDVIAPGVNILAAWPADVPPTESVADTRRTEFNIISGTSMACPHVTGIIALLKGAHPEWTPDMIRSALITTAYTYDHDGKVLLDETTHTEATLWVMGAGHVDPNKADKPGLVYKIPAADYVSFLCGSKISEHDIKLITHKSVNCSESTLNPWDLNYPTISVAFDVASGHVGKVIVKRTATQVSNKTSSFYSVLFTNPEGARMVVEPVGMEFNREGDERSYKVEISAENVVKVKSGEIKTTFGKLSWGDGEHQVTSPVVVTWYNTTRHVL